MRSVSESTGQALNLFYFGIDTFSQCIGDSMPGISDDIVDVDL